MSLNDFWFEEYEIIDTELKKINKIDSPLKIDSKFKGDKKEMLNHLKNLVRGFGLREVTLDKVIGKFEDFGTMWQNEKSFNEILGSSYVKFWEKFNEHLSDLITWQVPNSYTMYFHGKKLAYHSLGQRASALLLLILNRGQNKLLIIDQPEDDIDNQTRYMEVVKLLLKLKCNTQFIFVTHNANILVLGDSEQIIACEFKNNQIETLCGSIDKTDVQQRIIDVMEGGNEAFLKRNQVYTTWK